MQSDFHMCLLSDWQTEKKCNDSCHASQLLLKKKKKADANMNVDVRVCPLDETSGAVIVPEKDLHVEEEVKRRDYKSM